MIPIIHQTPNYLIINKPAGLIVHADGKTNEPTLVDWLCTEYPDLIGVGEDWIDPKGETIRRSGIVHRLDRDTSGVMVVARTQEMFESLKQQFKNHEVQKIYHAFVYGCIKENDGTINQPIGKSRSDFRQWSAGPHARGEKREAITDFRVLARFPHADCTYVAWYPKTGRTHQIRVHAKYINHPLVADQVYAGKYLQRENLGFQRQALHAYSISFHDSDGQWVTYEAPEPEDFRKALDILATTGEITQ